MEPTTTDADTNIIVRISEVPCHLKGRLQKFRWSVYWSGELLTTWGDIIHGLYSWPHPRSLNHSFIHPPEPCLHPSVWAIAPSIRLSSGFIHPSEPWLHPYIQAMTSSILPIHGFIHLYEPWRHPPSIRPSRGVIRHPYAVPITSSTSHSHGYIYTSKPWHHPYIQAMASSIRPSHGFIHLSEL